MNCNALVYRGNWSFEEPLAHLHYAASKPCSLEHKKVVFEIVDIYSLFDTESTFSFSKIGKLFEFLSQL